jgi:hypothetical protein
VTTYNPLSPHLKECIKITSRSRRDARFNATLKQENPTTSLKQSQRYADADANAPNSKCESFPFRKPLMCWLDEYLAVLSLVNVADRKARNSVCIRHGIVDIQESERSITALLSIHANNAEASALGQVVVQSNTLGKVRAGVESAGALVVIDFGAGKGVLEDPVGAGFWSVEALGGTVAGGVDAILEVEVHHRNDTGDVNALEVTDASAVVGRSLEVWELALRNFALADCPVVVVVKARKDVDVRVGVIAVVTHAEGSCENGGGKSQDGENGGG